MAVITRVLWALIALMVFSTVGIGVGAYLNPDFASYAPALLTAVLTSLVPVISGLGGAVLSRGLKQAVKEEVINQEEQE